MARTRTQAPRVPPRRSCGAMEVHQRLLERFPDFRRALGDLEHRTLLHLAQPVFRIAGPARIPVVVHVVFRTQDERISKAQIDSQIAALNRDYSATNADKANTPTPWTGLVTAASILAVDCPASLLGLWLTR